MGEEDSTSTDQGAPEPGDARIYILFVGLLALVLGGALALYGFSVFGNAEAEKGINPTDMGSIGPVIIE